MGSPLDPTFADAFLFYEKKWLEKCSPKFKPVFYRWYVDIFLFHSNQLIILKIFVTTLILVTFSFEEEKNGKMSFFDEEISRDNGKFVTTVYRKPTFSGAYTHFESFLPSTQKFDL